MPPGTCRHPVRKRARLGTFPRIFAAMTGLVHAACRCRHPRRIAAARRFPCKLRRMQNGCASPQRSDARFNRCALTDAVKTGCAVSRTETGAVQPSVRGLGAGGPSWDCSRQTAISVNWSAIAVSSAASMLRSSFDRFSAAAAAIAADTYTICSIPYGMPAVPRPVPRYEHSSAVIAGGAVCLSFAPLLQDPAHGGSVLARAGSEQRTDQKAQVDDRIQE